MSATLPQPVTGQKLLISAHPGHELLLFHWMETVRPTVFLLTDGSGAASPPRLAYSEACLRGIGATLRGAGLIMPDRSWYAAILRHEPGPFLAVIDAAFAEARQLGITLIVSDAVDGYNPMHDLCAAIGAAVAARLRRHGLPARHLVSAVTPGATAPIAAQFRLGPAAQARKRAAIAAYLPLAAEARHLAREEPRYLTVECLRTPVFAWPDSWSPAWESTGRGRVAAGLYDEAIEYRRHIRPMVDAMLGAVPA
jgi:hypothetical protein